MFASTSNSMQTNCQVREKGFGTQMALQGLARGKAQTTNSASQAVE